MQLFCPSSFFLHNFTSKNVTNVEYVILLSLNISHWHWPYVCLHPSFDSFCLCSRWVTVIVCSSSLRFFGRLILWRIRDKRLL